VVTSAGMGAAAAIQATRFLEAEQEKLGENRKGEADQKPAKRDFRKNWKSLFRIKLSVITKMHDKLYFLPLNVSDKIGTHINTLEES
jgi:hypothetical protein